MSVIISGLTTYYLLLELLYLWVRLILNHLFNITLKFQTYITDLHNVISYNLLLMWEQMRKYADKKLINCYILDYDLLFILDELVPADI